MKTLTQDMPKCACGGRKFLPLNAGKSRTGKRSYTIGCAACGKKMDVSKTVYALCKYLKMHEPSKAFLQLYQMES